MRAIFLSDLHLTTLSNPRGQTFLKLLENQKGPDATLAGERGFEPLTHLFLVGDIFDLWLSDYQYFRDKYASVVLQIERLLHEGVAVHYFEGNHDLYLTRFWEHRLGVKVHPGPAHFLLNGLNVRVEHGDQINPKDRGYRFLRWLLRTPVLTWLAHHLPESVAVWMGERASSASRTYTSGIKAIHQEETKKMLHHFARQLAQSDSFDILIHGHVHVQEMDQFDFNGRMIRSVNLGSWLEEIGTYLELTDQDLGFRKIT